MAYKEKVEVNVSGVLGLFEQAVASDLKYPKIRLQTTDGEQVVLSRAGTKSRYTGQVMVTNGEKFGSYNNRYFGRVDKRGVFHTTDMASPSVVELVKALGDDPVKVAQEYGRLTGNCCFCETELRDDRSTSVGYGPICAKRFGLPWGHQKAQEPQVVPEKDWESRVREEEEQGLTRSDAQAVVDAQDSKAENLADSF